MPLNRTKLVEKVAKSAFKECDLDSDGCIDVKELHVGLLLVYDKLNKALPVYLKPPKHSTIKGLLKKYDQDGSGHLDFEEFHNVVKQLVGISEDTKFTESIPFVIGTRMLLKMAIFPLAALAIKKLLVTAGGEDMDKIPNGVLAFGAEGVYKIAAVKLAR